MSMTLDVICTQHEGSLTTGNRLKDSNCTEMDLSACLFVSKRLSVSLFVMSVLRELNSGRSSFGSITVTVSQAARPYLITLDNAEIRSLPNHHSLKN